VIPAARILTAVIAYCSFTTLADAHPTQVSAANI